MTVTVATFRLFQQLLKRLFRQNKNFDKYQQSFLKKLQNSHSESEADVLYNNCIEQLCKHITPIEDSLSEGALIASQSQLQLKKLMGLSPLISKKIEDATRVAAPYTIIEHHNELTNLIKIYQRVVIELDRNNDTQAPTHDLPLVDNIADELQQIILDIDVDENHSEKLAVIRTHIANEENPLLLPQYCLQIITIIIDSTREERRSSRHFLYTLNDNLSLFYLNFSKNIKRAESTFKNQDNFADSIKKQSLAFQETAKQENDIDVLQQHISSYVEGVETLIQKREMQKEQRVRQQFQGMVRQIKELQNETNNYQETLKQQSKQLSVDFLTKIPNRVAWSERLEIEYTRFQRYQQNLNLAIIDIDNFKMINDTFGHLAGDKVLNVIAQRLQKSIRNTDFIARYGGEEFTLLLPDVSMQQTQIALEKLCTEIRGIPFKFKEKNLNITISIGYTMFLKGDNVEDTFERADQALYKAKSAGRDQVKCFENS